MRHARKILALTAAAATSAALAVGMAGASGAAVRTPQQPGGSTQNCRAGLYAGYCGTQKSGTGLYLAVGFGSQVIGTRSPRADNAEFFWLADGSPSAANNDKYAEFAPGGVASNRVMAEVNRHVVLVQATGAPNQKWVFNPAGSAWANVATGDVLKAGANGGPVLAVHGPVSGPSEAWSFVTP
jgi:hypothetical protein